MWSEGGVIVCKFRKVQGPVSFFRITFMVQVNVWLHGTLQWLHSLFGLFPFQERLANLIASQLLWSLWACNMAAYRWTLVISLLALVARVLQGGYTNFVQSAPIRVPLHATMIREGKWRQARSGVHAKRVWPQLPKRSSHTTRHFFQFLELQLVAEEVLGLGALSADFLGGAASCAISSLDVEFLASLPEAPPFLLGAVEADWLAAIGANVIGNVETGTLVEFAVATLERNEVAAGMAALSEEKQIEFACGILSRASPETLAEVVAGILSKVGKDPHLWSKLSGGSFEVVMGVLKKSPQEVLEVLKILLGKVAEGALGPAAGAVLLRFVVEVLPGETIFNLVIESPTLLAPVIETAVTFLPQERLLDLAGLFVSQASPAQLAEIIKTAVTVLPKEKLLELGSVFLQSSPETFELLRQISPEAAREAAEISLGTGGKLLQEDLKALAASGTLAPVGEYEFVMIGDAVISAVRNSSLVSNSNGRQFNSGHQQNSYHPWGRHAAGRLYRLRQDCSGTWGKFGSEASLLPCWPRSRTRLVGTWLWSKLGSEEAVWGKHPKEVTWHLQETGQEEGLPWFA